MHIRSSFFVLFALALAACGNNTGNNGEQIVDFDTLDVDFDTLDVDVTGGDVLSQDDALKQDTIGGDSETKSDVQLDIQPDVPPECTTEANCNDGNPCTTDGCDAGTQKCTHVGHAGPCEDGSFCTLNDSCQAGVCVPGLTMQCDDSNACTDDSCDKINGCVHLASVATCTDGNVCTVGDACSAGKCVAGGPVDCDDSNLCTDDTCDFIGGCVSMANAATCDDGDACTVGDTCSNSTCGKGGPKDCDDKNACTVDSCGGGGACLHLAVDVTTACDDANICTVLDTCVGATCTGVAMNCPSGDGQCTAGACDLAVGCTLVSATGSCNDGNICTQTDTCKDFLCLGADVTDCNDGMPCTVDKCVDFEGCDNSGATNCDDSKSCTNDSCDLALGCTHTNLASESACDDGNACTFNEACDSAGTCTFGQEVLCDDNNVCTVESCDPKTGCVSLPIDATCTDKNPCTSGDFCDGGYCVSGFPTNCDDSNDCTYDYCQSGILTDGPQFAGGCQHSAFGGSCEDGNPCTIGDSCDGPTCFPGQGNGCDDGNACTNDACSDLPAGCTHTVNESQVECNDGNVCTNNDMCNPLTGACVGSSQNPCEQSGDPCVLTVCDPINGCGYPAKCDDGDNCTTDACDLAGTCTHTQLAAFHDSFAKGNAAGWTLGAEWQIGTAKQGPQGDVPPGDPALGYDADNQIAGVVIGGNAKRVVHGYAYLTSPVIDTTALTAPTLEFWRWLDADATPFMTEDVEAWDGQAWQTLWETTDQQFAPMDGEWNRQILDLTAVSNAQLQIRFGFKIGDAQVLSAGSWNVDDVTVGESGQCVAPILTKSKL
jgi:hypothetical protein